MKRLAPALVMLLLWSPGAWPGQARSLEPPPTKPNTAMPVTGKRDPGRPPAFEGVPQMWRDYLTKARAADFIDDPLQRCLAYPDLPGNRWPRKHAAAHCRYAFAYPPPTLTQIAALLDAGKLAQLEGLMDASQRRHLDEHGFSEDIHRIFSSRFFTASTQSDQVTAKWLQLAPDSAYANLARGNFLAASAWAARGTQYVANTPRSSMQRMSELAGQAIPLMERAAQLKPDLMPAYTALIDMATADSRGDVEARALERARKVDPACLQLAKVVMIALKPRWGGDHDSMLRYSNELLQHESARPLLAMQVEAPLADRADQLVADDQYTAHTLELLDTAVSIGSDEDALHAAANVALNTTDVPQDLWKGAAYLLQESRFRKLSAWSDRSVAWALVREDPEWSLRHSLRALESEPDNAWGHYLAGAGWNNLRHDADADREYAIAIKDPGQRQASLREVAEMWLFSGFPGDASARRVGAARAKPYIERLTAEYPADGRGWVMKFFERLAEQNRVDESAIRDTLEKVDRTDAWQSRRADQLQDMLDQIEAQKRQRR